MKDILWTALLSMTPLGELRVGLPYGLASGLPSWLAFAVAVIANILVVPVLFFFLEFIHHRFMHHDRYRSAFDKFMERSRKRVHPYVEKYGAVGLAIFVAIPIPGTGAYTASVAAWFFGMSKWKAFWAISVGVFLAGLIIQGLVVGGLVLLGI